MEVYKKYSSMRRYDPTNTTTLRNSFARQMRKRFNELNSLIKRAVVEEDCFALLEEKTKLGVMSFTSLPTPGNRAYEYLTSAEKIQAFMDWIRDQEKKGVLQVTRIPQLGEAREEAWTDMYVDSAYRQGVATARKKLALLPSLAGKLGEGEGVISSPFHLDRLGILYLRVFTDLKGITEAMDSHISRILAQGMVEGRNPREIGRMLNKVVTGAGDFSLTDTLGRFIPARRRAEILARTEIIRAHHLATIQEYRNWGVLNVKVKAEWTTAGDDRVCDKCAELEGRIFTLDEIENMIPLHPQCRCLALPVDMTGKE